MVKKTKKELYSGVSIPIDIMDQIEKFRKEHPEKKYRSRAEFIMDAIREKLSKEQYWEDIGGLSSKFTEDQILKMVQQNPMFKSLTSKQKRELSGNIQLLDQGVSGMNIRHRQQQGVIEDHDKGEPVISLSVDQLKGFIVDAVQETIRKEKLVKKKKTRK